MQVSAESLDGVTDGGGLVELASLGDPSRSADGSERAQHPTLGCSGRMNHVARVRKADSVPATMGFDDCSCSIIGCVTSPVSLQFQQNLDPGGDSRARRLHPT